MQHLGLWLGNRNNADVHRQVILLCGQAQWTYTKALELVQTANQQTSHKVMWLGDDALFTVRGLPLKQYKKLLGQECNIGIYDAHIAFKPSALLALAGTIVAKGILILCCPPWDEWPKANSVIQTSMLSYGYSIKVSHFIKRWQNLITANQYIAVYKQGECNKHTPVNAIAETGPSRINSRFASEDQQAAYEHISSVTKPSNFAIIAKRGRGKSVLMAMLADHYIEHGREVVVCTSLKSNAQMLIKQSRYANKVGWLAPDDKALLEPQDLLLIDEAANLPIQQTLALTANCKQFILSTTIDGYEGTGKGCINKLFPKLADKSHYPAGFEQIKLHTPLRYLTGDTLEEHLDEVFYLATELPYHQSANIGLEQLELKFITDTQSLSSHTLRQCMGLLSHAHYQTTPEDYMRIFDSPDNFLVTFKHQLKLVAIAVIIVEGSGLLSPIEEGIASGARRAKGHQMAQKLSLLLSDAQTLSKKIWRINRIAVLPELQKRGIGSRFLSAIENEAKRQCVAYLGASFSTNPQVLTFWQKNNYSPVSMGTSADKSTGEVSSLVVKAMRSDYLPTLSLLKRLYHLEHPDKMNNKDINENTSKALDSDIKAVYQRRILDYVNGNRSHHHLGGAIESWLDDKQKTLMEHCINNPKDKPLFSLLKKKWQKGENEAHLQKVFSVNGRKKLYEKLWQSFSYFYWLIASDEQ